MTSNVLWDLLSRVTGGPGSREVADSVYIPQARVDLVTERWKNVWEGRGVGVGRPLKYVTVASQ